MININSWAEKVKHKIEKRKERYSETSNSFDTGFFSEQKIGARQRERELLLQSFTTHGKEEEELCVHDRTLPEVGPFHCWTNAIFFYRLWQLWLKSLLPRSTCCRLAASTGVDINRKYEQIINTVITRTIGQNDFIFTTGQASIEWHKRLHLRVAVWKSLQCYLSRASAKLIHWLCFKS